jgi:hypothetical protein
MLTGKQTHRMILDQWIKAQEQTQYEFYESKPNSVVFNTGSEEMLRVAKDGFYVRGVRVPADDKEAETVYQAFNQWLAWANLQRK